ncbi:MAG: PAS domain-containing protein [Anaerolineae bacterium]|nr:PAS domain-containing protein [Anaerolineae bacterium]
MFAESWQIALLVIGTTICAILSRFTWLNQSENEPAVRYFSLYMGVVALRSFCFLMATVAPDELTALRWLQVRYLVVALTPGLWLLFVLSLLRLPQANSRWLTTFLVLVVPILRTALALTNDLHGLLWSLDIPNNGLLSLLNQTRIVYEPIGNLFSLYSPVIFAISLLLLVQAAMHLNGIQRIRLIIVILSTLPLIAAEGLGSLSGWATNLVSIAFPINGIILGYGIMRLHLLGILPLARNIYLQNALDAVIVTDHSARIIDVNRAGCELAKQESHQLLGQKVDQAFPLLPSSVRRMLSRKGEQQQLQTEIHLADGGKDEFYEVQTYPLTGRGNKPQATVIKLHNITEQRQIEMQLRRQNESLRSMNDELTLAWRLAEEADRTKGQFLATISHELRTPLHIMLGFTELLVQENAAEVSANPIDHNTRRQDYLERVLLSGKHLLTMINGLLDLSQSRNGEVLVTNAPFDMMQWFNMVAQEGEKQAREKGLGFERRLDTNLGTTIYGDRKRLTEIVDHLLSNAIKFTEHGTVTLEARQVMPGTWIIQVIDTGIGIPKDQQELIFQTFRQVDGSSTRRYGGLGVGLSLVRRLALLMGGQINLQSEEGRGSTFTIILPLITPENLRHEPTASSSSKTTTSTTAAVIVESDIKPKVEDTQSPSVSVTASRQR